MSGDYIRVTGMHAHRAYNYIPGYSLFSPLYPQDPVSQQANVPDIQLYKTDNRSAYNALAIHLQGNFSPWFNLTANYTLANAKTWGSTVGELFDYVNGVCTPLNAFAQGDYGPSGEDIRNRFVLLGVFNIPWKLQLSTVMQFESARPFTLTTPVDVNGTGNSTQNRAVINGVQTSLDQFRGTPYMQVDLKTISRILWWARGWVSGVSPRRRVSSHSACWQSAIRQVKIVGPRAANLRVPLLLDNEKCSEVIE